MTSAQDVYSAIAYAQSVLNQYAREEHLKTGQLAKRLEEREIRKRAGELVREAYSLDPSGNVCPRCGGTGRE